MVEWYVTRILYTVLFYLLFCTIRCIIWCVLSMVVVIYYYYYVLIGDGEFAFYRIGYDCFFVDSRRRTRTSKWKNWYGQWWCIHVHIDRKWTSDWILGMDQALLILVVGCILVLAHLLSTFAVPEALVVNHDEPVSKKLDLRTTLRTVQWIPWLLALIFFTTFNNFLWGIFYGIEWCVSIDVGFGADTVTRFCGECWVLHLLYEDCWSRNMVCEKIRSRHYLWLI